MLLWVIRFSSSATRPPLVKRLTLDIIGLLVFLFSFLELFARDQVFAYYNSSEKMVTTKVVEPKPIRHNLYSVIVDEINPHSNYLKDSETQAEATLFSPPFG
ncbi:cytochrome P450 [Apiospora rasikravindrae]|uniref:Cytochrome P450 n=1 Tax=Apiospora rasikravindrae TaxID=990691 RepID=A0ABR1RX07_9PEZI